MNNKVIYVDFKNGIKIVDVEIQNLGFFKSLYYKFRNILHFNSNVKKENGVYNFKKTM